MLEICHQYTRQRRKNGTDERNDALNVTHNSCFAYYSVILDNLEPDTLYYVRVIPAIDTNNGTYHGTPTEEGGPFATLRVSK